MEGLSQLGTKGSEKESIQEIIGMMFASRTYSHIAHLKTGSFAKHKALNGFYDDIVGLADGLAETSQGLYGKLNIPFVCLEDSVDDPIGGIESQLKKIERLSSSVKEEYLKNIFQEIQALYRSTLYLMKELS